MRLPVFDRGMWIMVVGVLVAAFGKGLERGIGSGLFWLGLGVVVVGAYVFARDS